MTIPPYAAGCVTTIVVGILSDRYKLRGPFVMGLSFLAIIGYAMLYATSPKNLPGVGYAGAILAACGVFPTVPIMLAWGSGNAGSSLKKAVIIGLLSGVGNLGGYVPAIVSVYIRNLMFLEYALPLFTAPRTRPGSTWAMVSGIGPGSSRSNI